MSGQNVVRTMRDSLPPPKTPSGGGGFDALVTIAAVLALGACAYFGVAWWLARPPSTPPSAPPPTLVAAVVGPVDVVWTAQDTAACERKARAARPADGLEFGLANPAVTEGLARLATMVECRISTKVERFCDPAEKAQLVAIVNDYLGRVDLVEFGLNLQGAPMKAMGQIFGGEMEGGNGIYQIEKDATLLFMKSYNDRIAKALRTLARNGLISSSDFGSFMGVGAPANVHKLLDGVTPTANACA